MPKTMKTIGGLLILIYIVGCAAKLPHNLVTDFDKKGMKRIAVMPVKNGEGNAAPAEMLRKKLVEELYFKGYQKIAPQSIDAKIAAAPLAAEGGKALPRHMGELLSVDAVLYPTLREFSPDGGMIYGSTVADAEFELFCAKTGDSLWRVNHRTVSRSVGLIQSHRVLTVSQTYEDAIQEVVTRALETLPDASDSSGS